MDAERLHIADISCDAQMQAVRVAATDGFQSREIAIPNLDFRDVPTHYTRITNVFARAVIDESVNRAERDARRTLHDRMVRAYQLDAELQVEREVTRTAAEVRQRVLEGQRRMAEAMTLTARQFDQMMLMGTPLPPQWSEAAEAKADRTLREFLFPAQQNTWDRCRFIVVRGGTTNSTYVIVGKSHTNIYRHEGDKIFRSLCFIPRQGVPLGDVILLQKLALEANETEAILTANDFGSGPSYYQTLKERWKFDLKDLPENAAQPHRRLPRFRNFIRGDWRTT